ncbi:MAG TPA: tRNA (adenosine(37)-N6)-threonylcarbamoyltransferase complex dimerization subunit type 1 TsaB [Solirubrobacteraceae bacterium]
MQLKVLGFDTATAATVVALLADGQEPLEARDDPAPGERPRHTTRLLALARTLLDRARLAFGDLDLIAVGTGPGSFTGLRIGVATARALAQATGAPVAGVSTLRALAALPDDAGAETLVLPVVDARRGEVFVAGWRGGEEVFRPRAMTPAELVELAEAGGAGERRPWLGVGDGAVRFRDVLVAAGVSVPDPGSPVHRVSAVTVCRLAAEAEPAPRRAVVPDYLRLPDAEEALRARAEPG